MTQLKNERKTIAKAIDIDLKTIFEYPMFKIHYENSLKTNKFKPDETPLTITAPLEKLYNEKTLLYFDFIHEIEKLDINLSFEIIDFYNDLFLIEKYSIVIMNSLKVSDGVWKKDENLRNMTYDVLTN